MGKRLFSKNHAWVEVEGSEAKIGITSFACKQLKDIVFAEIAEKGQNLSKGDCLAKLESVKTVSQLECPLSGEITTINKVVDEDPSKISENPQENWLVVMNISNPKELDELIGEDDYNKLTG